MGSNLKELLPNSKIVEIIKNDSKTKEDIRLLNVDLKEIKDLNLRLSRSVLTQNLTV